MRPSEWNHASIPARAALEHFGIPGFEQPAPQLGLDQQAGLRAPVVGKMQAVVFHPDPLVDPAQVEGQQVVHQAAQAGRFAGQIHEEILHAAQLLELFEIGDPRAARVPALVEPAHVAAAADRPAGRR